MIVVSNADFVELAAERSAKLRMIASNRYKEDPNGNVSITDLKEYSEVCLGNDRDVCWLKSLATLALNGSIERIRKNACTFEDNKFNVHIMRRAGEIKFDINDHVMCKKSERRGVVVDYIPSTKEFLVVLDPFTVRTYKADELDKVG